MWRLQAVKDGVYIFQRSFNPFGMWLEPLVEVVRVPRDAFWKVAS